MPEKKERNLPYNMSYEEYNSAILDQFGRLLPDMKDPCKFCGKPYGNHSVLKCPLELSNWEDTIISDKEVMAIIRNELPDFPKERVMWNIINELIHKQAEISFVSGQENRLRRQRRVKSK